MFDVFGSLKSLVKLSDVVTDNGVFKLHYQVTSLFMVAFSIIVSTNQFFGSTISCLSALQAIPTDVLNNYCWIHSTFTLPSKTTNVAYPGIDKSTSESEKEYHAYYQWVCFFLFFEAIVFYITRYIWKSMEGNKVKSLLLGLDIPIMKNKEVKTTKVQLLADFLVKTIGHHRLYAGGYLFCELLNFINVISQLFITDAFLGGEFTTYGPEVIKYANMNEANRTDPMIEIFPRITKCGFKQYGPSGDIQYHDALCVLPINIINEKIFIFMWFWFVILSIVSGLVIIYRIPLLFSSNLRNRAILSHNRYVDKKELQMVIQRSSYGDWFLLQLLSKNISSLQYSDLIHEMYDQLITGSKMNNNDVDV
ncbi:hypothetical protein CHUAL_011240 [Chamberlinius hualienensis]